MLPFTPEYVAYINSPEWKAIVAKVIKRDPICQACGDKPSTEGHHLTYDNLGHELLWEVAAICRTCHERIHDTDQWQKGKLEVPYVENEEDYSNEKWVTTGRLPVDVSGVGLIHMTNGPIKDLYKEDTCRFMFKSAKIRRAANGKTITNMTLVFIIVDSKFKQNIGLEVIRGYNMVTGKTYYVTLRNNIGTEFMETDKTYFYADFIYEEANATFSRDRWTFYESTVTKDRGPIPNAFSIPLNASVTTASVR